MSQINWKTKEIRYIFYVVFGSFGTACQLVAICSILIEN